MFFVVGAFANRFEKALTLGCIGGLLALTSLLLVKITARPVGWSPPARWAAAGLLTGVGVALLLGGICFTLP
ncbi:MAG TPA: hypothetical protein VG326_21610 [Tepidisphaeraceae bacterium]|jgi:hypothetical protein|nr:hypothetical protein [Tepidisphaeraceae bacterium]